VIVVLVVLSTFNKFVGGRGKVRLCCRVPWVYDRM